MLYLIWYFLFLFLNQTSCESVSVHLESTINFYTVATSCALCVKRRELRQLNLHLSAASFCIQRSDSCWPGSNDLSFSMPVNHNLSPSHQHAGHLFPNLQYDNYEGLIYNTRITTTITITWYVLSVLWHNIRVRKWRLFKDHQGSYLFLTKIWL